jgi:cysteinyl-tRNA synthetase
MNDDVNTPEALAILFRFMTHVNRLMDEGNIGRTNAGKALELMLLLDKVLGLDLKRSLKKQALPEQVENLVAERELARKIGDYARADAIRNKLRNEFGIVLEDTPSGVKWKKAG